MRALARLSASVNVRSICACAMRTYDVIANALSRRNLVLVHHARARKGSGDIGGRFLVQQSYDYLHRFLLAHVRSRDGAQDRPTKKT